MKRNTTDLAGRHIPERYLAGLPPALREQRIRELTESRDAYWKGDYSELPTDRAARKMGLVKESAYTQIAKERGIAWRGDADDMAVRVLRFYGAKASPAVVQKVANAISASFKKGLAAWKSGGHRPGATAQNWAVARVNSLVVGGKAAWTADSKQFDALPSEVRKKIIDGLDEVMSALDAQGRKRDVSYLAAMKTGSRSNPVTSPERRRRMMELLYPRLMRAVMAAGPLTIQRISTSIGQSAREDILHDAISEGINVVTRSVMFDDDDFADGNPALEANVTSALGIARSAALMYIPKAARRESEPVLPGEVRERDRVASQKRVLRISLGREPSKGELAATLGLTTEELQRIEGMRLAPRKHIAAMSPEGEYIPELRQIEDTSAADEAKRLEDVQLLRAALPLLGPAEQNVVRAFLGEIPPGSLGFNPEEIEKMVMGSRDPRTGRMLPGIRRQIAEIVQERRLLGLGEEVRGLKELPGARVRQITKKNR
jgi:hypothetical protein